jgi:hypothetical protein
MAKAEATVQLSTVKPLTVLRTQLAACTWPRGGGGSGQCKLRYRVVLFQPEAFSDQCTTGAWHVSIECVTNQALVVP